jgi:hypothetical protein
MPDLNKIFFYGLAPHIENIPHILKNGITHSTSPNKNQSFVPIGDSSLISVRSNILLEHGRRLGDYIPYLFWRENAYAFYCIKGI